MASRPVYQRRYQRHEEQAGPAFPKSRGSNEARHQEPTAPDSVTSSPREKSIGDKKQPASTTSTVVASPAQPSRARSSHSLQQDRPTGRTPAPSVPHHQSRTSPFKTSNTEPPTVRNNDHPSKPSRHETHAVRENDANTTRLQTPAAPSKYRVVLRAQSALASDTAIPAWRLDGTLAVSPARRKPGQCVAKGSQRMKTTGTTASAKTRRV